MRFLTDDSRFGLLVAPVVSSGEARFQLIVEGQLIGDTEPSFAYGAFEELGNIPQFSDKRLGVLSEERDAVLAALLAEEELHDPATVSLTGSLDRWLIQRFLREGSVTVLAWPYERGVLVGHVLMSVVKWIEYGSIIETARSYWAQDDERFRSKLWRVTIDSGDSKECV